MFTYCFRLTLSNFQSQPCGQKYTGVFFIQIQVDKGAQKMDLSKERSKGKKKTILSHETLSGCNIVPLGSWIMTHLNNAAAYIT